MDTDVETIGNFEEREANHVEVLDLSTVHYNPLEDEEEIRENAIMDGSYGWLVYAGNEHCKSGLVLEGDVSEGLRRTLETAREAGYGYVLFDRDAAVHPSLPSFGDEWAELGGRDQPSKAHDLV